MGMNVGGSNGKVRPEMNVTPLVDVVLVLLIIFMVVTPLLTKKMWLNLPKKDDKTESAPPPTAQTVVVTIDGQGRIRINAEELSQDAFAPRLSRVLAARTDRTIFFDAADGVDFGSAMQVIDLSRGAGATTIAVLTEKLASP